MLNALLSGLGEKATRLRLFANEVTVYPNPAAATCYARFY